MPVEKGSECVQVVVRCRPMNSTEKNENCQNVCDIDLKNNQIYIRDPANPKEVNINL
jgi:kinesin family protein 3/17